MVLVVCTMCCVAKMTQLLQSLALLVVTHASVVNKLELAWYWQMSVMQQLMIAILVLVPPLRIGALAVSQNCGSACSATSDSTRSLCT
eukprot:1870-Heterococcus_DN1.PRE.2